MNFTRSTHFIVAAAFAVLPTALFSQVLYWDTNGADPGSSLSPGDWTGTATNWSTSPEGDIATQTWDPEAFTTAIFSAGTNATGDIDVNVETNTNVSAIQIQEGNVTFSGSYYVPWVGSFPNSFVNLSTVDVAAALRAPSILHSPSRAVL